MEHITTRECARLKRLEKQRLYEEKRARSLENAKVYAPKVHTIIYNYIETKAPYLRKRISFDIDESIEVMSRYDAGILGKEEVLSILDWYEANIGINAPCCLNIKAVYSNLSHFGVLMYKQAPPEDKPKYKHLYTVCKSWAKSL